MTPVLYLLGASLALLASLAKIAVTVALAYALYGAGRWLVSH